MDAIEELNTNTEIKNLRTAPLMSVSERRNPRTMTSARNESDDDEEDEEENEEENEEEDEEEMESDLMKGIFGRDFGMEDDSLEWTKALSEAESVADGMVKLYDADKETFFLHGYEIRKALEYRFSPDFVRILNADSY